MKESNTAPVPIAPIAVSFRMKRLPSNPLIIAPTSGKKGMSHNLSYI